MGAFDYRSFTDVSSAFNSRRGTPVETPVWQAYLRAPQKADADVATFAVEGIEPALPQSRFADLSVYRPVVKSLFITPPAVRVVESVVAVAAKPDVPSLRLSFVGTKRVAMPVVAVGETPKPRRQLTLKTKVELPTAPKNSRTFVSARSSAKDLAAAFKHEKKKIERFELPDEEERPRHPLSSKSWSELLAEADAVMKKPKVNIDLASAFKAEMRALQEELAKQGDDFAPPAPARLKTAFEPKIKSGAPRFNTPAPARDRSRTLAA